MDKNKFITIGKWAAMIALVSGNFLSYSVSGSNLNLILAALIFAYSIYEFFHALSGRSLHIGIKMYLFTFYLFGVVSLFAGLQSFLAGHFNSTLISFTFIAGDVVLILYSLHKFSRI
ncbi:MAG TPA: hypothetical protein VN131_05180 [Mobilitalea sp.]|nr:hypothetical protein [Mobilitalea sp.]